MTKAWEKEKAYCAKRAEGLRAEMEAAINNRDILAFDAAYKTALRYMPKRDRAPLYRRFLEVMINDSRY